jgi:hypothetical protein
MEHLKRNRTEGFTIIEKQVLCEVEIEKSITKKSQNSGNKKSTSDNLHLSQLDNFTKKSESISYIFNKKAWKS